MRAVKSLVAALISEINVQTTFTKEDYKGIVADLALDCVDNAKHYDEDATESQVYQRATEISHEIVGSCEYAIYSKYFLTIIQFSDSVEHACELADFDDAKDKDDLIAGISFECLRADVDHKILKMYQAGECEIEKDEDEDEDDPMSVLPTMQPIIDSVCDSMFGKI